MHRRKFLAGSVVALASATISRSVRADNPSPRMWFEIRKYRFDSDEQMKGFADLMTKAGVGAFNRAGAKPVGLFRLDPADNPKLEPRPDANDLWMVIPHNSAEEFAQFESKVAADEVYQSTGKDVLNGPKDRPPFARYDTLLLRAFAGAPSVTPPELNADRVLELRTYQSRNPERAANKIAMFEAGEIPMFKEAGMPGVFFGGAMAGWDLPNLTYMVCHPTMESVKENWAKFQAGEDWKKLKAEGQYKDNVSKIVSRFLRPMPASQL